MKHSKLYYYIQLLLVTVKQNHESFNHLTVEQIQVIESYDYIRPWNDGHKLCACGQTVVAYIYDGDFETEYEMISEANRFKNMIEELSEHFNESINKEPANADLTSITKVGLSERAMNCCLNNKILTVEDLLVKSEYSLKYLRGCGVVTIEELVDLVHNKLATKFKNKDHINDVSALRAKYEHTS